MATVCLSNKMSLFPSIANQSAISSQYTHCSNNTSNYIDNIIVLSICNLADIIDHSIGTHGFTVDQQGRLKMQDWTMADNSALTNTCWNPDTKACSKSAIAHCGANRSGGASTWVFSKTVTYRVLRDFHNCLAIFSPALSIADKSLSHCPVLQFQFHRYCTSRSPEPTSPIVLSVAQHPLFGTL